jgi:small subunit ribosomal protein S8
MSMTDPVADMLTRIRNGIQARAETVELPASKLRVEVAKILKAEGFIAGYRTLEGDRPPTLTIELKYSETGEPVIQGIERVGRPGRRVVLNGPFATRDDVKRVIDWEESLHSADTLVKADLYDTLVETVTRSLGNLTF